MAKGVVLGLLPLVLLIALTEVALSLLGVAEPADHNELSRGFDPDAPFFEPDPDHPGGQRMLVREDAGLPVLVPPDTGRTRVFLFGGSNTHSFPEEVMQTRLGTIAPERSWEVVNLGRPGFGSERVRILLDQALELGPDAIVIYSGHNEFVERGFQRQLSRHLFGTGWTNQLLKLASKLRSFRALEDALRPRAGSSGESGADVVQNAAEEWRWTRYDQTLVYYEAYRENLRAMCRAALERDVAVVLCTVVGNDWSPPRISTWPPDLPADVAAELGGRIEQALDLVPERFLDGLRSPILRTEVHDWGLAIPGPEIERRRARTDVAADPRPMRLLQGPLAATPATLGKKTVSMAGAHHPEPILWSDAALRLQTTMATIHARELDADERRDVGRAAAILQEVLDRVPDHPRSLWYRGLCVSLLGDDAEARRLLTEAAIYDRAPRRGNPVTNAIVREVAAEFPQVLLVEAAEAYRQAHADGLVGYELMTDVCHLQPGARIHMVKLMAAGVRRALARDG